MSRAPRRTTLGAWLALVSIGMSVLLTVLLTLLIGRAASEGLASNIGASVGELASQTANRLDRGMFERYREVQLMAGRLAGMRSGDALQAELDAARNSYRFYVWFGLTDMQGTVREASGGVLRGTSVADVPWFRRALLGGPLGDVHTTELPGTGSDGKARIYDVAFPVPGPNGPSGVLAAYVSWDWARDVRQAVFGGGLRGAVEPLVVGADGTVLMGPPDVEGRRLDLESLRRAAAGESGYLTETWPDGETYVVGYTRSRGFQSSPGLGWRVLVRQDIDVAYAPIHQLQRNVLQGGIAMALLFSLLGWLGARIITRPLQQLTREARQLEEGREVKIHPSSAYREVEVLGTAINALLGKLNTLNADLERRVEQRTAELRAAFERVRANEQRVQTIIETAQDPFIAMDMQGRIIDWSTRAEAVFGWPREEAVGRPVSDLLVPPRYAGSLEASLQLFEQTGQADILGRPIERIVVDRDGREIPVEVKIGLVSTGDQRFFSAFLHDISQRKEVERLKDEFVSTVSHELRTPLTAVYGSLDLLASGVAGELPPEAQQLLKISHESTDRLVRLINDMLDLEKIASGKIEYRMQPQSLRPLVQQAIRDTAAYAEGLQVRLALAPGADARVDVDADRIVQVCVNLLSNAAKFSPTGDEVGVVVQPRGATVRVTVTDRGPGVPPEFQARVFERFAQADASDSRAKGGTGLGLSICRSIVEAHGGTIDFASQPGLGTEFWFELPVVGEVGRRADS